ncbi:alpha/beta-hydrolase [Leucogyrophana mollusca]|uniref:Alpha/beta-hydrolase n=1 Tax=Leucogyrophana mollusca TaxID=85980 RepID=A0ACB8BDI3_9AGAM|nr:alpha/beta-hydrolase [Leucogyrophana mollusca]
MFKKVDNNANETYLTKLLQDFIASDSNFTEIYEEPDLSTVSNTYTLSGTLCVPLTGEKNSSHVQYLVHGIGFDSRYWDFSPGSSEDYSYVAASASAGIATFRYDRLGTGLSEKPYDAYNVVQYATDVAIAVKFAQMLRDGSIGRKFSKVVGVGHSYGSIQTQAITALAPTALDAVILTGYSVNASALPIVLTSIVYSTASQVSPTDFPADEFSNAYLVTLAPQTFQLNFWYYPYYSQAAFDGAVSIEQPVTQGVIFTFGTTPPVSSSFTGPVHVVTGGKDWIFCFENCYAVPSGGPYTSVLDYVQELFPATNGFSTYIPPNTGHEVNLHYSAPTTYQNMLQFAESIFS